MSSGSLLRQLWCRSSRSMQAKAHDCCPLGLVVSERKALTSPSTQTCATTTYVGQRHRRSTRKGEPMMIQKRFRTIAMVVIGAVVLASSLAQPAPVAGQDEAD